MNFEWKKVAMIMLAGLLVFAGPIAPRHALAQGGPGVERFLMQAQADHDKAMQMYNSMTMKMNSMKSMQMNDNEKGMMSMMQQMANTLKMLLDANQQTINALKELKQGAGKQ